MRCYAYGILLIATIAVPAHAASTIGTCPLCPCPPPPGCTCPNPPPPGCLGLGPRFGFDSNADIEPGDFIQTAVFNVDIVAPNVTIYLLPPINQQSLLPPASPPMTYDQEVRTFVSSYSCFPNDMMPSGACPISLNPQSTATNSHVTAIWSPTESLPGAGSYIVFRLALEQPAGLPALTLFPTQTPVATVMGQVQFHNTGLVPVNYTVYRLPASTCTCNGDMNADGQRNGRDIRQFVSCVLGAIGVNCDCGDIDGNGTTSLADVPAFVSTLISGLPCP